MTFGAVIGFIVAVLKSILFISLAIKMPLKFSDDDIVLYKLFGIYIEKNKPYVGQMDVFMSLFFDLT